MVHRMALGVALVSVLAAVAPAVSQGAPPRISTTEAQLLSTFNGAAADDPYLVLTLQHFSLWKYGSNFFFVDVAGQQSSDAFRKQPGIYLEYAPVLSLGRTGVLPLKQGSVLRDVGVTAQYNTGWTTPSDEANRPSFPIGRVFLEGVELAWSVPGFAVFNTSVLARQEKGYDPSWQLNWVYNLPFAFAAARGSVQGFMDVWRREAPGRPGSTVVLAQPQLLLDLGTRQPGQSFVQVGVELEPSHHFPVRGVNDGWNVAVSPMVRWVF